MRKIMFTAAAAAALGLVAAAALPANAVSFPDADLSAGSPNAGVHEEVGSVNLAPGEWTITAGALLFVADPEGVQKNSQGCGLYADGVQIGGAGGSSSGWTLTTDGKTMQLDLITHPWSPDPSYDPTIVLVLDDPATVTLECFIDASHSGVTHADREGMSASDIFIDAVQTTSPENFGQSVAEYVKENGGPPPHAKALGRK
jgi:hypothetical protein